MEFFHDVKIDWLKLKWYFLAFSMIFSVAGILSMIFWHGIPLGIDFRGGTNVQIRFAEERSPGEIRSQLEHGGVPVSRIQRYGDPANHEVLVSLDQQATSEQTLDKGKNDILRALHQAENAPADKQDLNNVGSLTLQNALSQRDPLQLGADAESYAEVAHKVTSYRDHELGGVFHSFDQLRGQVAQPVIQALQQDFYLSSFGVRNVEIVGPQVGQQLQKQAALAVIYSLIGMLIYIGVRFKSFVYGVAAVVAVFHDTLITVGVFSLTNTEISLTVIAALLTLVGYSMNDTIVVFDRIRENLKLLRREQLGEVVNRSINQTLSRTVLTSGLTFLTVLALYLWGGEVLHGFSLALVVGIVIGTYSSIAVAAPMLVAWQDWRAQRSQGGRPQAVVAENTKRKVRAKA